MNQLLKEPCVNMNSSYILPFRHNSILFAIASEPYTHIQTPFHMYVFASTECVQPMYGFERKCNRIEQFRYVKLNVWSLGRALVSQLKPYDALVILLCQIQCFFVVQLEPN